jgi:hypothetical protein
MVMSMVGRAQLADGVVIKEVSRRELHNGAQGWPRTVKSRTAMHARAWENSDASSLKGRRTGVASVRWYRTMANRGDGG